MRFLHSLLFVLPFFLASCSEPEDPNALLRKEVKAIDDYLAENETGYIAYDASGIRLVVHEFGEMPAPEPGQSVQASVKGSLFSSGSSFTEVHFTSKVDSIGQEGLNYSVSALMGGTRATVYVPSQFCYGPTGTATVPPNSIIVYEIDLREVFRTTAQQERFVLDTAAIYTYLKANSIENVTEHPSGIFYTLETEGSGEKPRVYDNATFTYSGSFLTSTSTFDAGTLTNHNLFNLIQGLRIGIPLLRRGGSVATFYIPSGLAYGTAGSGTTIPPNSILKFRVSLN